nr:immunoglobulin light chain junction region [Macaca mulatta]
CRQYDSYPRTF